MISVTPELKAVISLLEDTDPVVKESVDTYIKEHFAEIEYLLPDILDEWHFSRKESALLFDKMVAVNAELTMAELEKAVKEVPEDYIYEWFLLNKMILISADFTVMSASLISMANVLEQGITASDSPWKKAEVFNSAFFGKLGLVQLKSENIPLSALLPSEVPPFGRTQMLVKGPGIVLSQYRHFLNVGIRHIAQSEINGSVAARHRHRRDGPLI